MIAWRRLTPDRLPLHCAAMSVMLFLIALSVGRLLANGFDVGHLLSTKQKRPAGIFHSSRFELKVYRITNGSMTRALPQRRYTSRRCPIAKTSTVSLRSFT